MMLQIAPTQTQIWLSNLPTIITSITTLIVAITGFYQLKKAQGVIAANAAEKVETVKVDLAKTNTRVDERLTKLQQTADDTHKLVNNAMSIQLKLTAEKARRVAELTHDPVDVADAVLADEALAAHQAKQKRVDKAVEERAEQDKHD